MKNNASRPSETARLIARSLVLLARDPAFAGLVPPDAAEASGWFLEGNAPTRAGRDARRERAKALAGRPWYRALTRLAERRTLPGIVAHYALRKRFLEDAARRALTDDGFTQVVVLGAGFDTLALRLAPKFPQTTFVEVDHPATQIAKQEALARHDAIWPNLHFAPADLSRSRLASVLDGCPAYRPDAATLFVAEGLLMYLDAVIVSALFRDAAGGASFPRRFAFTFLEPDASGAAANFSPPSRFVDRWLRRRGEPFRWGVARSDLNGWLTARGWTLSSEGIATPDALRECYLSARTNAATLPLSLRPARGDLAAVADAENAAG